jgi:DNA polymerase-3 subunit gamma/tau
MAYEPLHHKYRPQTFAELVGQEAIAKTISSALQQQRIPPAYLFCGPRGTGKTSSARILAKSLNCISSDRPTAHPCGTCETCRSITRGNALDVIEIDAASNTGVDNIRELIERAQFAPVQCRFKVYVIDECHMLSTAAFNALLKTLEEPPEQVVFVLATTDPQRVLPTIISRCQRFDFRRIPLDAMIDHLGTIARNESISIKPDALQLVAQIAQGGLRDAESLLDQLSLIDGDITVEQVWDLVGAVPERDLMTLIKAIASNDGVAVLEQARHLMNRGREPLIVLQNLAGFYRDLLIAKTAGDRPDLAALTAPTWAELCDFAQSLDISLILLGQQHLRSAEVQVKNTTQPRLWLEVTLMGLLPSAIAPAAPTISPTVVSKPPSAPTPVRSPAPTIPPTVQPTAPPAPPQSAPPASSSPPSQPPTQPPAAQPPQPEPPSEPPPEPAQPNVQLNLSEMWQDILKLVEPISTQAMLRQQCSLGSFNGTEAVILTNSPQLFRMAKERMPKIEVAFKTYFQRPIALKLEVADKTATQSGAVPPAPAPPAEPPHYSPPPPPIQKAPTPPTSPPPPAHSPSEPPPTDAPPPDLPNWEPDDDVTRAAKFLAQTFNGQLVDIDLDDPQDSTQQDPPSAQPNQAIANEGSTSETSKPELPRTDSVPNNSAPNPDLDSDDDIPF